MDCGPEDILKLYDEFHKKARELFIKKDSDYGSLWLKDRFNGISLFTRLFDKSQRLANLFEKEMKGEEVYFENIEDTLLDLHNYSAMLFIYRELKINQVNNDAKNDIS